MSVQISQTSNKKESIMSYVEIAFHNVAIKIVSRVRG